MLLPVGPLAVGSNDCGQPAATRAAAAASWGGLGGDLRPPTIRKQIC